MKPYDWGEAKWQTFYAWCHAHGEEAHLLVRRAYEPDAKLTVEHARQHPLAPSQIYGWPIVTAEVVREAMNERQDAGP